MALTEINLELKNTFLNNNEEIISKKSISIFCFLLIYLKTKIFFLIFFYFFFPFFRFLLVLIFLIGINDNIDTLLEDEEINKIYTGIRNKMFKNSNVNYKSQ